MFFYDINLVFNWPLWIPKTIFSKTSYQRIEFQTMALLLAWKQQNVKKKHQASFQLSKS